MNDRIDVVGDFVDAFVAVGTIDGTDKTSRLRGAVEKLPNDLDVEDELHGLA